MMYVCMSIHNIIEALLKVKMFLNNIKYLTLNKII